MEENDSKIICVVGGHPKTYDILELAGIILPEETKIQINEVCNRYDVDIDTVVNIIRDDSTSNDLFELENKFVNNKNNKKKNKSKNWNKKRFYD